MTEDNKIESVVSTLREQIKEGSFGTKGRLPSVTQLAKDHQIARSTVYQALLILQAEGLIIVKVNSFYANSAINVSTGVTPTFEQMLANQAARLLRLTWLTLVTPTFEQVLANQGLPSSVRNIIDPEVIIMPDEIASMFRQPTGLRVVHRYRIQGKVDIPYRLSEYWYPEHLAHKYLQNMKDDPSYDTLEAIKSELGIVGQQVHDDVFARIPTKYEATLLSIPRSSPVQEVRRTNRTSNSTVLMHHRIVFVGPFSILGYDYKLTN